MTDKERSLVDFVSSVAGDAYLKVEEHLGDGFVRLRTGEAERRQAKHDIQAIEDVVVELLRNARDAEARRIFVVSGRNAEQRELVCVDDGCGVPDSMRSRIFEPRVTSKLDTMVMDRYGVHGRGMALFSIRSNVDSAEVLASGLGLGTAVRIVADTRVLGERRDQSTWPVIANEGEDEEDEQKLRGPRNIIRMVCEFALDRHDVQVWVGSASEVAATLYSVGQQEMGAGIVSAGDASRFPLWQRLAPATDAADLTRRAAELGIELSERNAHRVISGEVRPLAEVRGHLRRQPAGAASVTMPETRPRVSVPEGVDLVLDRRSLRPTPSDLIALQSRLASAFDEFAKRYYLELKDLPKIHVGKNEVTVRFVIDKE